MGKERHCNTKLKLKKCEKVKIKIRGIIMYNAV